MTVTNVEKKEKSIVRLSISVTKEAFEEAVQKSFHKNAGKFNVPGFRKGKAPRKIIEQYYGPMAFYDDALQIALPEAFEEAVREKELKVVGYPDYDGVDFPEGGGLTFTADAPVYPEVALSQYKGLTAYKPPFEVSDVEVDREVFTLQERNARQISVDREIKSGDTAVIDFEGFKDGVPFEGGKGENHALKIGSGQFIPGFEDQLIGKKAGEDVLVKVTFPKEYAPELAGADAEFKVKINEVKETEMPELDDEFAKDVSEFDTMEALRADLKKKLTEDKTVEAERQFADNLMKEARKNLTADIPDAMVDEQLGMMIQQFENSLSQQGMNFESYLKMTGMEPDTFRKLYTPVALEQVQSEIVIRYVADHENLEVTDEDLEAEYKRLAEYYGMDIEQVKKYAPAEAISGDLKRAKALDVIKDSGVVTDVDPDEVPVPEDGEAPAEPAAEE